MENTSYGINVANRYDLFCIDDDAGDPIEAILKSKQKQQKKQQQQPQQQQQQQQQSGTTTTAAAPAAPQQAKSNAKSGEKENKAGGGGGGGRGAENRHPDKSASDSKHAQTNGTGNHLHNQRSGGGERRGIKETQKDNIRNQENQRGTTNPGAKFPRGPNKNGTVGAGGGDDKYPRKPRDFDGDGQRKPYAQNGGAGGGVKRFDGRGKRELDRQSGSNKTGIKAVDKRDGAGSHNWGSSKQDAKEYSNNPDQDYQPQDADTSAEANPERTNVSNGGEEAGADGTGAPKSDDEAKEMTLDEWKAQKAAVRLKPQYNLRKAGEGEDSSQWDKMVALDRKSNPKVVEKSGAADGGAAAEEDDGNDTQTSKPTASGGGGGKKQFLEIEYHFNDSRRGGLGRSRGGRGGRGGGGGGRGMGREGGPGGRREYGGGDNYRSGEESGGQQEGGRRYNNHYGGDGGDAGGGERPQRDFNRRNNRPPMGGGGGGGPDRNYEGGMNNKYSRPNPRSAKQHVPAAPKVDDEHDFPSLG
ncbi:RNA-binding protein FUS-like [Anopheles maculipalpis]|uniref:RNA-binding protein FUS-like n=1 Tax=Anopheles maculipalpis TaxID=1496333 RepID=UPI002159397D|nr:RNA-binding protein FUS-like [Anopheles maculipalpis]